MTTKLRVALSLFSFAVGCTPTEEEEPIDPSGSSSEDTGMLPPAMCPDSDRPTMVSDVTTDTTWTAAGSPYVIDHGVSVRATLTLEPCTEVLIGADVTVIVRDAGSIVGIGTEEQPIRIGAVDPEDPWSTIHIYHGNRIELAYATVEDGGDLGNIVPTDAAMIYAQAVDAASPDTLHFDHVTIRGSVSQGIRLIDGARFSSDSTALVATENASYPVNTWANGLSTVPDGNFDGNGDDAIFVVGGGTAAVTEDVTIHDRGVPYVIGNGEAGTQLRVSEGAALTIEPGVELQFGPDGALHVDYGSYPGVGRGALIAVGTADAPIVFTSSAESPAPGDWYGIYVWNQPDPRDVIAHARVEFAGGVSQIGSGACTTDGIDNHDAAIRFLGTGGQLSPDSPSGQIVTDTQIVASAGSGIDRGWFGAPIDFLVSNEFVDVAQCWQSYPHPESPDVCPDPAPCPQQ